MFIRFFTALVFRENSFLYIYFKKVLCIFFSVNVRQRRFVIPFLWPCLSLAVFPPSPSKKEISLSLPYPREIFFPLSQICKDFLQIPFYPELAFDAGL